MLTNKLLCSLIDKSSEVTTFSENHIRIDFQQKENLFNFCSKLSSDIGAINVKIDDKNCYVVLLDE